MIRMTLWSYTTLTDAAVLAGRPMLMRWPASRKAPAVPLLSGACSSEALLWAGVPNYPEARTCLFARARTPGYVIAICPLVTVSGGRS